MTAIGVQREDDLALAECLAGRGQRASSVYWSGVVAQHDAGIVRWSMASYVGAAILAHGSLQPPSGQVAPANEESARAAMLVRPTALAATMP